MYYECLNCSREQVIIDACMIIHAQIHPTHKTIKMKKDNYMNGYINFKGKTEQ